MTSLSIHEVVRISKSEFMDGCLKLREYAFLTDHSIHMRITELDTDDQPHESTGWLKGPGKWPDLDSVISKILQKEIQGWTAVWGRGYGPEPNVGDYIKTVEW